MRYINKRRYNKSFEIITICEPEICPIWLYNVILIYNAIYLIIIIIIL